MSHEPQATLKLPFCPASRSPSGALQASMPSSCKLKHVPLLLRLDPPPARRPKENTDERVFRLFSRFFYYLFHCCHSPRRMVQPPVTPGRKREAGGSSFTPQVDDAAGASVLPPTSANMKNVSAASLKPKPPHDFVSPPSLQN